MSVSTRPGLATKEPLSEKMIHSEGAAIAVPEMRQMLRGALPNPVANGCLTRNLTCIVPESSSEASTFTSPMKFGSMSGTISHAPSSLVPTPSVVLGELEGITRRPGGWGRMIWLF